MTTIKARFSQLAQNDSYCSICSAGWMSEDREIWKSAHEMIDRFGDDALTQIKSRIDELQAHGEEQARDVWLQILEAARALLKDRDAQSTH